MLPFSRKKESLFRLCEPSILSRAFRGEADKANRTSERVSQSTGQNGTKNSRRRCFTSVWPRTARGLLNRQVESASTWRRAMLSSKV